jgi:CheY-like chemotaxis protein
VVETLSALNYSVREAANAEAALRILEDFGPVDLLLTDVVMPGGGGPRLAQAMSGLRPATRVLYMSGYPGGSIAGHGLAPGMDLLAKPFSPEALLRRVADALSGRVTAPAA